MTCPSRTASPRSTNNFSRTPSTWLLTITSSFGSSVPTDSTERCNSCLATLPVSIAIGVGAAAASACSASRVFMPEQAGRRVSTNRMKRTDERFMKLFLIDDAVQKNRNECLHNLFAIVRLGFLKTENLLPQYKTREHAEEAASNQLRIHSTKHPRIHALLNVICNRIPCRQAGYKHVG